jgi:O-antigen ligase
VSVERGLDRAPLVWRSLAVRATLAAFPAWCTVGVLFLWTVWRQKLLVGGVAALTLASPAAGLITVAALMPFGAILESVLALPFRIDEEVLLAFFAVWLLRAGADRRGPHVPRLMAAAGVLLSVSAVASAAMQMLQLSRAPGEMSAVATWLRQAYYINSPPIGLIDAMRLVEGLGLVAATLFLFRQRPSLAASLPAAICASGAVAGFLGVLIHYGVGPSFLVDRYSALGYRTAHLVDPNAAGSYFACVASLSLAIAWRARGWERGLWLAAASLTVAGLWFSESKSALMAFLVVGVIAAGWTASAERPVRQRLVLLAAILVLGAAAAAVRLRLIEQDPTFRGGGFRTQFNAASLRMIAARPITGVGIGQYYAASTLFLGPEMAFTYGRENAHDYFLQVGAELGLPGLVLLTLWLGAGLTMVARALTRPIDPRLIGAASGIVALLATCLTGHPLLVAEVAFPFWIVFALALALATSTVLNDPFGYRAAVRSNGVVACAAVALLIGAAAAVGGRKPLSPPDSFAVNGVYPSDSSFAAARWTSVYASVFVPSYATRVYIPVRQPIEVRAVSPMGVTASVAGRPLFRTEVGGRWVDLDVPLAAPASPLIGYKRIDLKVDRGWQPAVYLAGSADLRQVGVQLGPCRVVEWIGERAPGDGAC